MRKEWTGALVGKDEYESKQPQLGPFRKVIDPQALQDARPPTADSTGAFVVLTTNGIVYLGNGNWSTQGTAELPTEIPLTPSLEGLVGTVAVTTEENAISVVGSAATGQIGNPSINTTGSSDVAVTVTGSAGTGAVGASAATGNVTVYAITVASYNGANKYYIDGSRQATLTLSEGSIYRLDQSSGTNSGHPIRFSTTSDGTHGGGSEYTTGVTTSGTPGNAGAYTQITVAASAPTLYYYCTNHSGMGGQANT
tara:strand:+ start:124 stop:882 length:759 start_codon:yes stop_codon:yes gene_type:complete